MQATANDELVGTLNEIEENLVFAHASLDESDEATVAATRETALAFLAVIERHTAELRAKLTV